jgi:Fe-S oxidoreductase
MGFDAEKQVLEGMGMAIEIPDSGYCGMAGSFGYEAGERYRVSMAAGERVLLPKVRDADANTLIVADGFSCRGQIASGTKPHRDAPRPGHGPRNPRRISKYRWLTPGRSTDDTIH